MKTKNRICIRPLVITFTILILFAGCKEKDDLAIDPLAPITFNPSITYGSMTDQDGNIYKTVTTGTQIWMAENLKTTKYRNGDLIPNVTDNMQWGNLTTGAYCNYDNDTTNANIYGRLYNWYAVNESRSIAPTGWHVPNDTEWTTLTTFLGGQIGTGGKLKETGTNHWKKPNTGATNETGFTALPGGSRYYNYFTFAYIGLIGSWWSATETDPTSAWHWEINCNYADVFVSNPVKQFGLSIRCVKDN
jgi:uncharacterized protein (TIGR02145 family)